MNQDNKFPKIIDIGIIRIIGKSKNLSLWKFLSGDDLIMSFEEKEIRRREYAAVSPMEKMTNGIKIRLNVFLNLSMIASFE